MPVGSGVANGFPELNMVLAEWLEIALSRGETCGENGWEKSSLHCVVIQSMLPFLSSSSRCLGETGDGLVRLDGETGERPLGVCTPELIRTLASEMFLVSIEAFRDWGPDR